jgi:hypothetical protein
MANTLPDNGFGRSYCRDNEIIVDKDGIPHFNGNRVDLLRTYFQKATFSYECLEGDGNDEEAQAADLAKKQRRFAKKLIDALEGKAYDYVEDLTRTPGLIMVVDGYKAVFEKLRALQKEGIVQKGQAFDAFFNKGRRKRGMSIAEYLRLKQVAWSVLRDLDEDTNMSDDLMAWFLLQGARLTEEQDRNIIIACSSTYEVAKLENILKVNFHDIHEKEPKGKFDNEQPAKKKSFFKKNGKKRHYGHAAQDDDDDDEEEDYFEEEEEEVYGAADEDEEEYEPSDIGGSGDDEVYQAYTTYDQARKDLKTVQKQRGFFKGEFTIEQKQARDKARAEEKTRSRCNACGRIGHWAGDPGCTSTGKQAGHKKGLGKGKKGRGKGKKRQHHASMATAAEDDYGTQPLFFNLAEEDDGMFGHAEMAGEVPFGDWDDLQTEDSEWLEADPLPTPSMPPTSFGDPAPRRRSSLARREPMAGISVPTPKTRTAAPTEGARPGSGGFLCQPGVRDPLWNGSPTEGARSKSSAAASGKGGSKGRAESLYGFPADSAGDWDLIVPPPPKAFAPPRDDRMPEPDLRMPPRFKPTTFGPSCRRPPVDHWQEDPASRPKAELPPRPSKRQTYEGSSSEASSAPWVPAAVPAANPQWSALPVHQLKVRLDELGLQTSGRKADLIKRLEGHYMGIAQVKKGCSIKTQTPGVIGMAPPPRPRGNVICGDCGGRDHAAGDTSCLLYRSLQSMASSSSSAAPSTAPPPPAARPAGPAAPAPAQAPPPGPAEEALGPFEVGDVASHWKCNKCGGGMVVRKNRVHNDLFWSCLNFPTVMRCENTFSFKQGLQLLERAYALRREVRGPTFRPQ